MKKIVLAVTTDLNYDQRMQRISSSLAQAGYQVLLVGRKWPKSQPMLSQNYSQHRFHCFFTKGKLFYLEYTIRIFWYLCLRTFDVYVAADLDTALPVLLQARLKSKPFIYDAHEYFPGVVEVIHRPWIQKAWLQIEKFVIKRTYFAYTVNQSLADVFYQKYNLKFAVIRNFTVLASDQALPVATNEKYLLYQGALNEGRGLEALLHAMVWVDLKLMICGKGDVYERLINLCEQLNLGEKVVFKGYVRPNELKSITKKAFIGINLLENKGLNYYYSLGNKFFDYLHSGVPQLIVNFPEYLRFNNQYQVAEIVNLEPTEIAAKINYLLQDTKRYHYLVQNCLRARQEWNWQKEEKKLLAFYANVWESTKIN